MHGARTLGTDLQATLQVPCNVTCDPCHASHHETLVVLHAPTGHAYHM